MVSVTEHRYTIGYLVPDTRLANASLSRREPITATQVEIAQHDPPTVWVDLFRAKGRGYVGCWMQDDTT